MIKNLLTVLLMSITITSLFGQNNSQFISQMAPASVDANEIFNVTVTFKNTGSTIWKSSDSFSLGTQGPQDNTTWGVGTRVPLPNDVSPGTQVTFSINLTAPSSGDGYGTNLQWQMVQDGVAWFGEFSEAIPIIVGNNTLPEHLLTNGTPFSVSNKIVGTSMFHWYGANIGQVSSPWLPLEGRVNWTGEVDFWKRMIKQTMAANIDVFYVLVIPTMEQERINLFRALNELRREGWSVPKVCPFFDPFITYDLLGFNGEASTTAGKDEIVGHYIRFYKQYYSVNFDQYADDYIYTQDNIPVLDVWHVETKINNYWQLTRADVSNRLSAEFGAEHPIFNNGIKMITTAISNTFSFADEKVHQFEVHEYYIEKNHNGIVSSQIKPGYWDQNVRNPGFLLPRNGGVQYTNAWAQLNASVNRVYIESFNEYDEGSGIYAAKTDVIYKNTSGGFNNTGNDVWSNTNDPYEYIKTTAVGAASFNNITDLDAKIVWHDFPTTMTPGETISVNVIVRNTGDTQWNAASNFKLGQQEFIDPVLFGAGRFTLDDSQDDIPDYGGIFRGRAKTFTIDITAPLTTGTYNTHWSMLQEGVRWFGEVLQIPITVSTNNSKFISQVAPTTVYAGEVFTYSATFENSGTTTWTGTDGYNLGSQNPQDNTTWGIGRVQVPHDVLPGEQVTFTVNLTAPLTGTGDNLQWKMIQEGIEWFGEQTNTLFITVTSSPSSKKNTNTKYKFIIYPNPISGNSIININGNFFKNDIIILSNILGSKIAEQKISRNQQNTSLSLEGKNLKEGIYLVQIISDSNIQIKKVIIKE